MTGSGLPPEAFSHPGFARVAAALARHAGLKIPPHRIPELETYARRAMARAHRADPDAYATDVETGHLPLADLVSAFTVGETYFFRDPPQFELIRGRVVPDLRARRPAGHVLRAWSAGCATGEEAYSLAFTFERLRLGEAWHVLGTDISRPSLARARAGVYRAWSVRGTERGAALRALERSGGEYAVPAHIRSRVRFEYLNLAEDAYPSVLNATVGLDLILCRNVFIYFERDVVAAVARRMYDALADGGWLLTGLADPPLRPYAPLEAVSTPAGVVYRRPSRGEPEPVRWYGAGATTGTAAPTPTGEPLTPSVGPAQPARSRGATPTPTPSRSGDPLAPSVAPAQPARSRGAPAPALEVARAAYRAGDWRAVVALAPALSVTAAGAALAVRAAANAGDLAAAADLAGEAVALHPLSPELHLVRAAVVAELGREQDALAAIGRAIYLDRTLAVAHAARAATLGRLGDVEGARRSWRNVRRLCAAQPPDAPVPLGDGQCAGRLSEIASAQLSILGGDPDS